MNPLVSIVILNWNGRKLLKNCLTSIKENTSYPNYEIIVVDNGSTDGSQTFIKESYPNINLIENKKNLGFSKANNQGIIAAGGDFIFLLNNDTQVTKNWLTNLIEVAESDSKIGIVGCKMIFPNGEVQHAGGYITNAGIGRHYSNGEEGEVEYVTGASMLIKREVIDKIGLLDEKFTPIYFEDTDLCFRARKAGFKVVYTPKSSIMHYEAATTKQKKWMYFVMNRNRIRFMLLNFSKIRLLKAIPWEILRILKNIFKLRIHLLIKAYCVNLIDINEILKKRKER